MKTIFKIFTLFTFMGIITSCSNSWLDVEPSDSLPVEKAIENMNDAENALNGMYDRLQGNSSLSSYYGARMIYYGDVRGDDMQSRTSSGGRTGSSYFMNYTVNSGAPQIWQVPYKVIRSANRLLEAINQDKIKDAETDAQKKDLADLKGQALSLRSLAYFDLLRVYSQPYWVSNGSGMGIPIELTPSDFSRTPGRNTIEEVYTQIIQDLKESIELMKPMASGDNDEMKNKHGYFTPWASKALLARVYLYKEDNANALATAIDIINNSPYKLWTTEEYTSAWSKERTSEVLFEIVNASTDDWVDRESIGYLYAEDGYADAIMTKSYVDFTESKYQGDVRLNLMLKSKTITDGEWGDNKVFINKYPGREGFNDIRVNNIAILRLSETYLIAAEAAAKMGNSADAAKYLNVIVLRGNPNATPVAPADATVDRILEENRIEFIGEGHRFFDLLRNKKEVVRYTSEANRGWHQPITEEASRKFDANYFRAILPIPSSELSGNPVIRNQQNPGY